MKHTCLRTLLVILYVYDINRLSSSSEICACHTQIVYRVRPSAIPDTVQESLQRIAHGLNELKPAEKY